MIDQEYTVPTLDVTGAVLPNHEPQHDLRSYALAALAAHLPDGHLLSRRGPEIQYMRAYLQAIDPEEIEWSRGLCASMDQPCEQDLPVIDLGRKLGLTRAEVLTVVLAAAVEDDAMVGRAIAHIQAPLGGSRPTLSLLAGIFGASEEGASPPVYRLANGPAVQSGLLTIPDDHAPLPERAISVPLHLCLALAGHDGIFADTTIGLGDIPPVPLAPSILAEAQHQANILRAANNRVLAIRTGSLAEGRSAAATVAEALGCRPVFITGDQVRGLVPWLILRGLLPVFCYELAPGERKLLPSLPLYYGPALVLCGPDGNIETTSGTALNWKLPIPNQGERKLLWEQAIGCGAVADELARYHRHGSGRIAHLGRLAHHQSALHNRPQPTRQDIAAVAWIGEGSGLDALAQPLNDRVPDAALVMTPALERELITLLQRCRLRDTLTEGLGLAAATRYHPGVRALFVGASGTGKTLAASWLAERLGLPLYRVDLASVTSKYIGETEKNLAQLLARAEQAEVVLLFDEADSLFGKRTDVKEANDRFANAQTNYLLQRIESFDGITLLTSNSRNRFDSAFARRLDLILDFPTPDPAARRALWLAHLGQRHTLIPREINQLAALADLTGGYIRNAVLTAAALAQHQGRLISYADIVQGMIGEYNKLSRPMPIELMKGAERDPA